MGELHQLRASNKEDFRFLIDEFMAEYNKGEVVDALIIWRSKPFDTRFEDSVRSVITMGWWSEQDPYNIIGMLSHLKTKLIKFIEGEEE